MKINIKLDKEMVFKVGEGAWRLTKHVIKKGIQQTVMETAGSVAWAALDGDMAKAKEQLKFDSIVGAKKVKEDKPKKKWFSKKEKETEEVVEDVVVDISEEDTEIIDKE